jgi:hypothetical protein
MKVQEMAKTLRMAVEDRMGVRAEEEVCVVTDTNMLSIA